MSKTLKKIKIKNIKINEIKPAPDKDGCPHGIDCL
jgi:hypothetical protein